MLGGFDAETFLLLKLIGLEQEEDQLELRQEVVGSLRTKLVVAKEGLSELFCTEIGISCSGHKESALLEEWRKVSLHGKCVYREGLIVQNWGYIKWQFVIEVSHKQIQIGIVEH